MKLEIKNTLKKFIPVSIVSLLYRIKPSIQITNLYLLKPPSKEIKLSEINSKYIIRQLNEEDKFELKRFYGNQRSFEGTIQKRLYDSAWVGLVVIDKEKDEMAYVSWIIKKDISFIRDFKIRLQENQFFLRHGYCSLKYRHQGLHTRMEQERINYCIKNNATDIYIQIADKNQKGITSVLGNGFVFYQKNYIFRIPIFGVYRELFSFIKNPFKRIE